MKRQLIALLTSIMILAFSTPVMAADFSAAYRVNSDVITVYEIDQMTLLFQAIGKSESTARSEATEFLINDRLITREAARIGLEIEPVVITRTLDTMGGGDGVALRAEFNSKGIADATIDTYVNSQILRKSYAEIRGVKRSASAEERIQKIERIPDQVTKTVSVSEIVIPYAEYGGRIPARYERKLLMQRYRNGESFAKLAREFSRSPTGAAGGELPEMPFDGLNEQLSSMIQGLKPGNVARPIETEGAIILIRLNGFGENVQSLPRDPLVSYVDLFLNGGNDLNASSREADKMMAEVQTCKYAQAKVGTLPNSNYYQNVPVSSLTSGLALALARMETGTFAKFERETGTSVLYLCDRQIKVPDELQSVVDNRAISETIENQLDGLLRDLRVSAKIVKLK